VPFFPEALFVACGVLEPGFQRDSRSFTTRVNYGGHAK
jgi:hypothetical protein